MWTPFYTWPATSEKESEAGPAAPPHPDPTDAHLELWDGKETISPTGDYWREATSVHIWELQHEKTAASR